MIYVIIQFSLLAFMGYNTPWSDYSAVSVVLFSFSILLGSWSILSMGLKNLSIFPRPKQDIKIRTNGPYKWIRHPMYTSVIIFSIGLLLLNPVWYMYLAFIVLVADLIMKLEYEEKKLLQIFENYSDYKKNSYCLIPFIY